MKSRILILIFIITGELLSAQVNRGIFTNEEKLWLHEHKNSIRYAPSLMWPPGEFIDEKGIPQGIVTDYIKLIESELNIKFNYILYKNWNEIYNNLLNHEVDFVGAMHMTDERQNYFIFSDIYLKVPLVILMKNDHQGYFSPNRLNSMKIACVKGYITQNYLTEAYEDIHIKEFDDDLTSLLSTSMGNTDGTLIDIMTACYLVEKYGITNLSVGMEFDFTWELRMAFHKETAPLASIINKTLANITEQQRHEIYTKWVNINYVRKPGFYEKHGSKILTASMIIIISLFGNFLFNYFEKTCQKANT